jgi:hypothetical protein
MLRADKPMPQERGMRWQQQKANASVARDRVRKMTWY